MDGPEVIMDAEEYLQPAKTGQGQQLPNTVSASTVTGETTLPPLTPSYGVTMMMNASSAAGSVYGAEGFSSTSASGAVSALAHHMQMHGYSRDSTGPVSLRYCSDPLQLIGKELEAAMEDRRLPHKRDTHTLNLPVDEDDYLMPSPGPVSGGQQNAASGYMDLIGDSSSSRLEEGDYHGRMPDFVRGLPAIKRMSGLQPMPLSMDNPEYHMMSHQQQSSDVTTLYNPSSPSYQLQSPTSSISSGLPVGNGATLGIPVNSLGVGVSSGSSSASSSTSGTQLPIVQFPAGAFGPRYLTQRSSEEEGSDHDYYNDLQRELQPLQPLANKRNETTV